LVLANHCLKKNKDWKALSGKWNKLKWISLVLKRDENDKEEWIK
jgi:hypothetical protein